MIDLHLHMDGSLDSDTIIELAKMQNIKLPTEDKKELEEKYLQVGEDCPNLVDYLKRFDLPLTLLQTKESLEFAFYSLCSNLKNQGLVYAEIRFAPQLHTKQGLTQEEVILASLKGKEKSNFKCNLILCCMRGGDNMEQNIETVKLTHKFLNKGVCACDLAGAEALFKTNTYDELFALANKLEVPFTLHAGEADGADSVYEAIMFGANRVGHGVRSIESDEVVELLKENNIPIEVCPKSNRDTKVFEKGIEYPVKKLFDKGVLVTINTDNMTVSNTTLIKEFSYLKQNFNFAKEDFKKLLLNSVIASFIHAEEKEKLKEEIENKFESFYEKI